ncbi:cellobiohydrolaseI [Fistulina hepatica ATCC 64428]|uniref:Glucanase n=1 Tax=Fistulina hepatica ATCC 64428 TaxID=1128425 RepID=A0A0D7AMU3_9AGAR|nr:cellobiohydrolaseI [Fistulina hepatica ATCC 64428]
MFRAGVFVSLFLFTYIAVVSGQQVGTETTETHPTLSIQECDSSGSCTTLSRSVTLDANWRWVHEVNGTTNCYTGNEWDTEICTDPDTCAKDCALDGADYESTYGITTSDDALTLKFVTDGSSTPNVGSRVYLLEDDDTYQKFDLRNQEFTFTVNVSSLPCGLNGALYFVEMDADGGKSEYANNAAGAAYGTGYCDSQCPHDIKFIDGEANILNWTASTNNANTGTGYYGTCCNEMDVWESNSVSAAVTPHVCNVTGQYRCSGEACGDIDLGERYDGVCDKDGCDFNSYRMGDKTFYGSGMTVDTSSVFTVVTQYITSDNTTNGTLSEIRRLYIQDDVVIANSVSAISGMANYSSITDDYCVAQKTAFNNTDSFEERGGLSVMGDAFANGMVLVMSLWDDYSVDMLWLDSDYPTTADPSTPGVARGTCSTSSGVPATVESEYPDVSVTYSNIKYGPIGSTYSSSTSSSGSSAAASSAVAETSAVAATSAAVVTTSTAAAASDAVTTTAALVASAASDSAVPSYTATIDQSSYICVPKVD